MANKKGPLSIAEKFYIVQNPHSRTDEELAVEMNRTLKTIQKVMKEAKEPEEVKDTTSVTDIHKDKDGRSRMRQLILHKTGGQKRPGVSIMTKEASELADDTRKHRIKKTASDRPERYSDAGIAEIFPDKEE